MYPPVSRCQEDHRHTVGQSLHFHGYNLFYPVLRTGKRTRTDTRTDTGTYTGTDTKTDTRTYTRTCTRTYTACTPGSTGRYPPVYVHPGILFRRPTSSLLSYRILSRMISPRCVTLLALPGATVGRTRVLSKTRANRQKLRLFILRG